MQCHKCKRELVHITSIAGDPMEVCTKCGVSIDYFGALCAFFVATVVIVIGIYIFGGGK